MKYSNLIIICVLTLSSLSCSKSHEEENAAHSLEQFIGRWVPVEYIIEGKSIFDINSLAFFGFYADSFEIKDTSGNYYPAFYINDVFDYTGYIGNVNYSEDDAISFEEKETLFETKGQVEKINDNEFWIILDNGNTIKLKKMPV